jgi:hypothetical protein
MARSTLTILALLPFLNLFGCSASSPHPPSQAVLRLSLVFLDTSRIVHASAVVADAGGLIFAPRHLIEGADVLDVDLPGHQHATAEMIYEDQQNDVAVLWVDGVDLPDPPRWKQAPADRVTVMGPDGSTPATVGADHAIRLPNATGEQGGKLIVDAQGNAIGMVVDRDKDQLLIVPASTLMSLRDTAIREANAGRATPFSPGSVKR